MKKIADTSTILKSLATFAKRYAVLLVVVGLSLVFGFLAYRINSLTQAEPTDEAVAAKLNSVERPRIDQEAIDKMRELEEENIEIKTLFEEARNNPFNE